MSQDSWLSTVNFSSDGLVPVVAQERRSGAVLMVAYANREALERTVATGRAHYYSRSRQALWQKGDSSGHEQYVDEIRLDCDRDTVLYRVRQVGPACHTGTDTCFSTAITDGQAVAAPDGAPHVLERLAGTIAARAVDRPEKSYTVALLNAGIAKVSQKVGEEAVEVVVAANAEDEGRLASESADLLYHLLVLLQVRGVPLARVWEELENRSK